MYRACLHYLGRACSASDCANQGARSVIWSFQMSDKQRRVAQSEAEPEGPGCFAPRLRCQLLM